MDKISALEVIKTRRSVREYENKPIPKDIIEDIIDCGRLAATARNIQPWEFVVFTDQKIKDKISAMSPNAAFLSKAPVCIAIFVKECKYYIEDGSAATQNVMLAAWAHGIGTCWIAGDKKDYAEDVRKLLGAPEGYKLMSMISLGYPAESPHPRKRRLKDMIHWERY